jgi:hypothetical protein
MNAGTGPLPKTAIVPRLSVMSTATPSVALVPCTLARVSMVSVVLVAGTEIARS